MNHEVLYDPDHLDFQNYIKLCVLNFRNHVSINLYKLCMDNMNKIVFVTNGATT